MSNIIDLYHQLSYYTLSLSEPEFIHQLIVDTFAAQTADENTKPLKLTFALISLYLVNEKGFTGRQVQKVHMDLAKANQSKLWPKFSLPQASAAISVADVLAVSDSDKKNMIRKWSQAVWQTWQYEAKALQNLLDVYHVRQKG